MKLGKVWGTTELLLRTSLIEVHRLMILPGARCSLHLHQHKWNAFFVQKGVLYIEVVKKSYNLTDVTELCEGDFTTVQPGEEHRFTTDTEGAQAIEIYYPAELSEDIVRRDIGGIVGIR